MKSTIKQRLWGDLQKWTRWAIFLDKIDSSAFFFILFSLLLRQMSCIGEKSEHSFVASVRIMSFFSTFVAGDLREDLLVRNHWNVYRTSSMSRVGWLKGLKQKTKKQLTRWLGKFGQWVALWPRSWQLWQTIWGPKTFLLLVSGFSGPGRPNEGWANLQLGPSGQNPKRYFGHMARLLWRCLQYGPVKHYRSHFKSCYHVYRILCRTRDNLLASSRDQYDEKDIPDYCKPLSEVWSE